MAATAAWLAKAAARGRLATATASNGGGGTALFARRHLHATIKELLNKPVGEPVSVRGWVLSVRPQKRLAFLDLSDGTTVRPLQVVSSDPAMRTYGQAGGRAAWLPVEDRLGRH